MKNKNNDPRVVIKTKNHPKNQFYANFSEATKEMEQKLNHNRQILKVSTKST